MARSRASSWFKCSRCVAIAFCAVASSYLAFASRASTSNASPRSTVFLRDVACCDSLRFFQRRGNFARRLYSGLGCEKLQVGGSHLGCDLLALSTHVFTGDLPPKIRLFNSQPDLLLLRERLIDGASRIRCESRGIMDFGCAAGYRPHVRVCAERTGIKGKVERVQQFASQR